MKKLLYTLLLCTLFVSCSKDDDSPENGEINQGFTSFLFQQSVDKTLPNCVAAYKKDGKYYKLSSLGDLSKIKQSPEIKVEDKSITEIYFFTDYYGTVRFDAKYILKENIKNVFILAADTKGLSVTDKSDPTQYPQ